MVLCDARAGWLTVPPAETGRAGSDAGNGDGLVPPVKAWKVFSDFVATGVLTVTGIALRWRLCGVYSFTLLF